MLAGESVAGAAALPYADSFAQTIEFAAQNAIFAANSVPNSRFAALKAIFAAK